MTNYQSQSNALVAYKVQSGKGTQASGSGGTVLRQTGGTGARMTKATTASGEVRRDGMQTRGRHGTQATQGDWTTELCIDSHNAITEAVVRDTWDAADLVLTQSDFTSLAIASNVITLGSGDPRTLGLRVGDVIRLTLLSTTANNSKNLRIVGLTATTITIAAGDTLVDETADTSCTITRPKKLIQYAGGSLIKRYFTIDEYEFDIDQSEVLTDFVWGTIKFSMAPNGIIMAAPGGIGTGQFDALASGASPLLTSPTLGSTVPLAVVDATIRVGSQDVVDLTSWDLALDIKPNAPVTFGSAAQKYSPDVFTGTMQPTINLTALRKDLQYMQDFANETSYQLHILACENESEPKDFFSIFVGNFTLGPVQKSALNKQGGPRTQTIQIPTDLIGIDNRGTGYDATMVKFQCTGVS